MRKQKKQEKKTAALQEEHKHCADYIPRWFVCFEAAFFLPYGLEMNAPSHDNTPEGLWLRDVITVASEFDPAWFLFICCSSLQPNKLDKDQMLTFAVPSDSVSHSNSYSSGKQENRSPAVKSLGHMRKHERGKKEGLRRRSRRRVRLKER